MRKLTVTEAGASFFALLDEVAGGGEVEITKHGQVVARLVPATGQHSLEGRFFGLAVSSADDDLFDFGAVWELE